MQRFIFLTCILFLCMELFCQEERIKAELQQADRLTKEAKYDEALQHVQAALEIDNLYLDALEKKLNIMLLSEKSKDITKEIDNLIEANRQQPEYYYIRALIFLSKQKPQKAVEDLENAIYYQMPEKYMDRIYLNRGMAYYNIGDFINAEADFQEAITLNPKYAAVYHSWGMLKYEEREYEEAVKLFNKAIQFEDNNAVVYYNLAMSYFRLDDMENACYYFNKACSLGYKNACKVYLLECTQ